MILLEFDFFITQIIKVWQDPPQNIFSLHLQIYLEKKAYNYLKLNPFYKYILLTLILS